MGHISKGDQESVEFNESHLNLIVSNIFFRSELFANFIYNKKREVVNEVGKVECVRVRVPESISVAVITNRHYRLNYTHDMFM